MPTLRVWLNGVPAADWTQSRGMHELAYASAGVNAPAGRALSLSLPFVPGNVPHRGAAVANYFDNLLPDSDRIRTRLRSRNPHWKLKAIRPRHWDAVTKMAGLGEAAPLLHEITTTASDALEKIGRELPPRFPAAVRDRIFEGLLRSIATLHE